jgi:hypothetical protein
LGFYEFCEFMSISPDTYGEKKWDAFQELSSAIAEFDDINLQKIINYSGEK